MKVKLGFGSDFIKCWCAWWWVVWCAACGGGAGGGGGRVAADTFTVGYITGSHRKEGDFNYQRPGLVISGALPLAVEEVNQKLLGPMNHTLVYKIAETYGQEEESIKQVAELWAANVSAYIGPQETCEHEGRMAAAFNLPMISYYCRDVDCSDKQVFPTFARTRPPDTAISDSVVAVLTHFSFMHMVLVYLKGHHYDFSRLAHAIGQRARDQNISIHAVHEYNEPYYHLYTQSNPFLDIVRATYRDTRVYVSIGNYHDHIGLVLALDSLHLLDKEIFTLYNDEGVGIGTGEYVAVGVDVEQYSPDIQYLKPPVREQPDARAAHAFRSYLAVAPSPAPDFSSFAREVNRMLQKPPFLYKNMVGLQGGYKLIPPEAAWLHDAVWAYARALAAQLRAGADPRDGRAIAARIQNMSYTSAMGYLVHTDRNGDAVGNYTVLALDPARAPGLYPLATFQKVPTSPLPALNFTRQMHWVAGHPPLSEPQCGFRGEKCINHVREIGLGVAGGALLLLLLAGLALYRSWRYEQELDSLLWKIDFRDVRLAQPVRPDREPPAPPPTDAAQQGSHPARTSQVSLSSNPDLDFRYSGVYCELVVYRGRVLALKRIHKHTVDITRDMKKELKAMRDIQHDNLNGFVGACTEPPNVCVISEYCTRGSLKDILEHDDFKLDNMFIASLVGDIIRGMVFIHESPIQYHGALKPANCLVDSRWVLKLSDFGLRTFRQGELTPLEHANARNDLEGLLYTAPEHLRTAGWSGAGGGGGACGPRVGGSPAGDVYSFSLLLCELHTRQGAFGAAAPPAEDVLRFVAAAAPAQPPYRPPLELLDGSFDFVRDCCCECWAEDPATRPDFKTIRTKLRPLRKGMKPNIFDNMMAMMEKYANNLEALVDERTDQLQEEKKKTEALLVEMLPAPVADQLKRGQRVLPESFSCVTIYFSDIVGFTAMSAESTPLQVVDFLNELYTCFDSILENYDVYKVETIGDAYMVVSGLPIRNGWSHAGEVASMALALLAATRAFRVRHRPEHRLMLRVGIHSGPVCAGVVGLKMPRYCLFGDTVNTASRFESTGAPLKIHCSAACKRILDKLGGYKLEERGIVSMKGKRDQVTYWLKGEDTTAASLRTKLRTARRVKPGLDTGQLAHDKKGPRSSLKNKNWKNQMNSLHRCCSLESPKKLRFASGNMLESHTDSVLHHRSDEYLMEVFGACGYEGGPLGAGCLEPPCLAYEHTSTSCPIIEHSEERPPPSPPRLPPARSAGHLAPAPAPACDIKLVINGHSFPEQHDECAIPLLADA